MEIPLLLPLMGRVGGDGNGGITAGWEKIAEVTLGAPAQVITIAGLNLTNDKAYMFVATLEEALNGIQNVRLYYNADFNNANYYRQEAQWDGGGAT